MGARDVLQTIHGWMAGLRRAVMANHLKGGLCASLAGIVALSILIMIAEAIGHFSGTVRWWLLGLWEAQVLFALVTGIVWPLLRYTVLAPDDKDLARAYANRLSGIRDRVLNALQLLERVEGANREGYSSDLILEAGRNVAEDLRPLDPRTLPDRKPVRMIARVAIGTVSVAALLMLVFGGSLWAAGKRVMKPAQDFAPPAPFTLTVKPGNVTVVRGDSLVVNVTASGQAPASVTLERQEKGKSASEPVTMRSENGVYRYTYRGITAGFSYYAHERNVQSETYDVTVRELPAVRFLSLRVTPPAYTNLPEQVLEENVGDVAAVMGTKVKLQLAATKALKEAKIEFLKPTPLSPPIEQGETREDSGRVGDPARRESATIEFKALTVEGSRAQTEFTVQESGYYRVHMTDQEGLENRDPILYRITARPDELPLVSLIEPSRDLDIAANVKVAVTADAADDFGFTRMALRYHRTSAYETADQQQDEKNYQTLPMTFRVNEPGKARGEMLWDLAPLELLPEDQVMFFVEVWDNDALHGPKRGRSETRTLRFPSMAEIFDKQEQAAQTREINLSDLLKESQDLRQKVDDAVQEFKSNPELSWERKKEIEKLMERQQAMNEMMNQISEAMQKAAQEMQMRSMFSPEVMDKLQQIQQLVKEVMTPEMRQALEKLAQAMKQPSEEELRKALENFQQTQQNFEQQLDQALNMLKQLKMAKKMDELTRRLDELGRKQDQLNDKMDQNTPQTAPKNSEEQKRLAEEMKKIEEEMRKLAEEMKKENTKGQQKMQELQKQSEQEKLSEQMQQNSQNMSMCQNQSAKKKGRHARRKMSEMANALQNAKQQMQQDDMTAILEKMEHARDQLLDLSMRQEKLWKDAESLDPGSPQMTQAAEEQENLRQEVSRINEDMLDLARQTMFMSPQLMASMSNSLRQMQQACDAAQQRDPRTASYYRQQALGALNGALKESNQACSSCKNSCNKPNSNSMCNNAGMMAGKQQNLTQQTRDLMEGNENPGSLSMGEQAAMQRIAVEQRELSKSAQQLAQEAAATRQSLGRLDDVAKDMEEAAKDLENRNVMQKTIERQEHIESRLLDFQRANREREFSPRRQAEPGVDVVRTSPQALPPHPGQDQLRQDLLRALDTKYTADYEQLIRAYFDALGKWK
jgi:hypothetical protein